MTTQPASREDTDAGLAQLYSLVSFHLGKAQELLRRAGVQSSNGLFKKNGIDKASFKAATRSARKHHHERLPA